MSLLGYQQQSWIQGRFLFFFLAEGSWESLASFLLSFLLVLSFTLRNAVEDGRHSLPSGGLYAWTAGANGVDIAPFIPTLFV